MAMRSPIFILFILSVCGRTTNAIAQAKIVASGLDQPETLIIEHGKTTFTTPTNMPGLTVKGKSDALHARAQIHRTAEGLTFDRIEASLAVETLATGIALRDQHMRQEVFTAPGGKIPEIRFEATNVLCPGVLAGRETTCKIAGSLNFRGIPRNFFLMLKIRQANPASVFRASGDGSVKLSDYGIEPPTQFGVKTADEVQIHLEIPETATTIAPSGK